MIMSNGDAATRPPLLMIFARRGGHPDRSRHAACARLSPAAMDTVRPRRYGARPYVEESPCALP
jgi:hypothetical protein